MENEYIIVLITTPNQETSEMIANTLLEKKLAACVNMIGSISSFYTWQGDTNRDEELLLIVKSKAEFFESKLVPAVQALHPYEVPEIIALPILMGSANYLAWIDEVTKQN
jgi:periplasmic divalent cation tolerance protein